MNHPIYGNVQVAYPIIAANMQYKWIYDNTRRHLQRACRGCRSLTVTYSGLWGARGSGAYVSPWDELRDMVDIRGFLQLETADFTSHYDYDYRGVEESGTINRWRVKTWLTACRRFNFHTIPLIFRSGSGKPLVSSQPSFTALIGLTARYF